MKYYIFRRSAQRAFISTQFAIILAIITGGAGLLIYEWRSAHHGKNHHGSAAAHHHHKKQDAKTAATN